MNELISHRQPRELRLGILAMVATAFLWSIAGLFIKVIDWNPFAIAGARSLISSLVVLAWLRRPRFHWSPAQVGAALTQAMTMLLFVSANKTTTAANAILLQYVGPVFTAIIGAWLLKERARWEHWLAFAFVGAGMVLLFMDKLGGGRLLGNVLALLSGLVFSFYYIFMRMQKDGSPLESILLAHWLTAAIGLGVALFLPCPVLTWKAAGAIAMLGIFQVGAAAILFSYAIKRITAISANLVAVIEPVFNPLWVFLALRERPGVHAIVGGAIIIAAVTGASIISARRAAT
ncbi:MAG: DMT family transporter [Acidobacteria bacterium]|jgi:drug/metabolite transporter (DMT)-like permease|nr:DMT family transporter [Acidobacteriota bacterium]